MFTNKISRYVWAFIAGLTLLLVVRDVMGIQYSKFILIGYCLSFCFCSKTKDLAPIICCMFPLTWGLPYTYIFLGAILLYWLKRKTILVIPFLLISFYFLLEIVASYGYSEVGYIAIAKYISVLSIFFTFLYDPAIDKPSCIKAYYVGSLILCAVILLATLKNAPSNWLYLFSSGWFRFGAQHAADIEGMVLAANANTLAYYSVTGVALSFYFIFNQNHKNLLYYLASLALFLVTGILTVSISWLITLTVIILILLLTQINRRNTWLYTFFIGTCLVVLGSYFLSKHPDILTGFSTRLRGDEVSTGDHRTTLFMKYLNVFFNNPRFIFMGTGVTQYVQVTNIFNAMHNMLEQIIVCYGIIAGPLFLGAMLLPLKKSFRAASSLLAWLPLVAVLLFSQTIQFVNPETLMLPYVIAFYALAVNSKLVAEKQAP